MFIKTNIIESINRVLKCTFISKRLCNNWLYLVKKMINYSHFKSKEINKLSYTDLNKENLKKVNNNHSLKFLKKYTPFYIKKYLSF